VRSARQWASAVAVAAGLAVALSSLPQCLGELDFGDGGDWLGFGDSGPWIHIGPVPPCIPLSGRPSFGVTCDDGEKGYLCVAGHSPDDAGMPPETSPCGAPFPLPAPHADSGYVGYCCP
jgi:hypothetical protein